MGGLFDEALQKTDVWLGGVASRLGDGDRRRAYLALRSTLHALRDRLLPQEAVQLGAQLPLIVRGFYYEGWRPTETPRKERHAEQFLARIRHEFRNEPEVEAGAVARAVFGVLAEHVTAGEIDDVKHLLPAGVRDLWP
jgi:uncharacterized protein (DUF2267 family)